MEPEERRKEEGITIQRTRPQSNALPQCTGESGVASLLGGIESYVARRIRHIAAHAHLDQDTTAMLLQVNDTLAQEALTEAMTLPAMPSANGRARENGSAAREGSVDSREPVSDKKVPNGGEGSSRGVAQLYAPWYVDENGTKHCTMEKEDGFTRYFVKREFVSAVDRSVRTETGEVAFICIYHKQAVKFRLLSGSTRNSLLLGHRDGTSLSELRFKFYEDPTSTAADGASDIALSSAELGLLKVWMGGFWSWGAQCSLKGKDGTWYASQGSIERRQYKMVSEVDKHPFFSVRRLGRKSPWMVVDVGPRQNDAVAVMSAVILSHDYTDYD